MVQEKHNPLRLVSLRRRAFALTCLFVTLLLLAFLNRTAIVSQLHEWQVLPRPDAYTELYFTSGKAPSGAYVPGARQDITFTVRNMTGKAAEYYYTIRQQDGAGNDMGVLGDGAIPLRPGQSAQQAATIYPHDTGGRTRIIVSVNPGNQQISYWQNRGE